MIILKLIFNKLEEKIKEELENLNIKQLETIYDLMKVERTKDNLLESVNDKFNEWGKTRQHNRSLVRYLS
jgi:ribosomal 50S subunit-associated protein YjgA (DUF615 family)